MIVDCLGSPSTPTCDMPQSGSGSAPRVSPCAEQGWCARYCPHDGCAHRPRCRSNDRKRCRIRDRSHGVGDGQHRPFPACSAARLSPRACQLANLSPGCRMLACSNSGCSAFSKLPAVQRLTQSLAADKSLYSTNRLILLGQAVDITPYKALIAEEQSGGMMPCIAIDGWKRSSD
jgi:hypothetical protein